MVTLTLLHSAYSASHGSLPQIQHSHRPHWLHKAYQHPIVHRMCANAFALSKLVWPNSFSHPITQSGLGIKNRSNNLTTSQHPANEIRQAASMPLTSSLMSLTSSRPSTQSDSSDFKRPLWHGEDGEAACARVEHTWREDRNCHT